MRTRGTRAGSIFSSAGTTVKEAPRFSSTHLLISKPSLMMSMICGIVYFLPLGGTKFSVPDGTLVPTKGRPVCSASHSKTADQGLLRISNVYDLSPAAAFLPAVV